MCLPFSRRDLGAVALIGAAVATGFTIAENARFFLTAPTFRVFQATVVPRTMIPVHTVLTASTCLVVASR
jgi:RsiW-degrading membrane proteinase PrsW (M82 family)